MSIVFLHPHRFKRTFFHGKHRTRVEMFVAWSIWQQRCRANVTCSKLVRYPRSTREQRKTVHKVFIKTHRINFHVFFNSRSNLMWLDYSKITAHLSFPLLSLSALLLKTKIFSKHSIRKKNSAIHDQLKMFNERWAIEGRCYFHWFQGQTMMSKEMHYETRFVRLSFLSLFLLFFKSNTVNQNRHWNQSDQDERRSSFIVYCESIRTSVGLVNRTETKNE